MEKRDCSIKMEVSPLSGYWNKVHFQADDVDVISWISMGLDDGFNCWLECLYNFSPKRKEVFADELVPFEPEDFTEARVTWGNEEDGPTIWNMMKVGDKEQADFNLKIHLEASGEKGGKYDFIANYKELCYATAKACTEAIKKHGLLGYYHSSIYEEWNLRIILFIKAVALDCLDKIAVHYADDEESENSSFANEMELLMFDM